MMAQRKRLAVFVSGGGTNLQALIDACDSGELFATVSLVVADNPGAFGLERAKKHQIPTYLHDRTLLRNLSPEQRLEQEQFLVSKLKEEHIDLIVLAGYLSIIATPLVDAFTRRIINLHPSLIPAYCGKGYYGERVHREVIANGETESGITIHYVDKGIDTGEIILQKRVAITSEDTPESLALKIHHLEHENLKAVISDLLPKL